ncbi:MAG: hypothetical protein PVS2B2_05450 [Candidatus Acidiferrum sp.]
MQRLRSCFAFLLSCTVAMAPVWGAGGTALGTVVSADRAHIGSASASVGTTLYEGDYLSTDQLGNVQLRAGAARLHLSPSTMVLLSEDGGAPSAVLSAGTATFSTANSKAFSLHASTATIRPKSDMPTIAQVTFVNSKEFIVHTTRGPVSVTVEDETQIIPEGNSYRVVLDPPAAAEPQGPQGAGTYKSRPPRRAGRSHFMVIVIAATAAVTWFAVSEALESPDRP